MKLLGEFLQDIRYQWNGRGSLFVPVHRVVSDSRIVQKGDIFVALKGPLADGHDFIPHAASRGAAAIIAETKLNPSTNLQDTAFLQVEDSHFAFSRLLTRLHGLEARPIQLIGVTGTNGKTTITYLIRFLLNQLSACGLIGTVRYEWANKSIESKNTTPGLGQLIPLLSDMVQDGMKYCVAEISSHGLDQNRLAGLDFTAAVFTNLTQDHLDYHRTLENYYLAKRKLFVSKPAPKFSAVNLDDEYGRRLLSELGKRAVSFGFDAGATYRAQNEKVTLEGSEFDLIYRGGTHRVKTNLPLRHNIYNVLAALSILSELDFALEQLIPLLPKFPGVPGRMERADAKGGALVFVDYAHTPDAVFNVLSSARPLVGGKIITVLGCGGNRDKGKRPLMGRIAGEGSDIAIVTSDNPRNEEPQSILDAIRPGIAEGRQAEFILDRKKAIERAIELAGPKDVVLILGKGHEKYQIVGDQTLPFDDVEVAQECLRKKAGKSHAVHS